MATLGSTAPATDTATVALLRAAERGDATTVQALAASAPTASTAAAAAVAAQHGHAAVVRELLRCGAEVGDVDAGRRPPRSAAVVGRARPGGLRFCVRPGALARAGEAVLG
mmetsp:Transcript_90891/g.211484  ORF Transcript_90891/g.211484 Transcript_90891/m.211484 type:complete len:111 (-) Transcript_90891:28-360(-)